MAGKAKGRQAFNLVIVAQAGRLGYEALILAASLRAHAPDQCVRFFIAEPLPGWRWPDGDPRLPPGPLRDALQEMGARFVGFESRFFGAGYPHGNKIECLSALPEGEPFLFLDTDTLVTGPLDQVAFNFARPSASVRVEDTWPEVQPYAGYTAIWKSLYDRFGLDFDATLDRAWPDDYWRRYLYFNAGWFFGACPVRFGKRFADYAVAVRNDPGDMLAAQSLNPWLDQVVLPLVIASFGGGRPGPALAGLDGDITCHWRRLPLLYARESDRVVEVLEEVTAPKDIKALLKDWEPAKKLIYQGKGRQKVRPLFDRADLPHREHVLRNTIRREGWWLV
ncbi:MAG: hypothetical protein Q8K20_17335 [Gemmobacter sp.]|nr:hypothetical protein [Gemmobacter sp.]